MLLHYQFIIKAKINALPRRRPLLSLSLVLIPPPPPHPASSSRVLVCVATAAVFVLLIVECHCSPIPSSCIRKVDCCIVFMSLLLFVICCCCRSHHGRLLCMPFCCHSPPCHTIPWHQSVQLLSSIVQLHLHYSSY